MGKEYIALIDVIPEDIDIDFEKLVGTLKKALPKTCKIETYEVVPIAYGLQKARVHVRYPEEWGGTDRLEEIFGKVKGIQGIEAIAFSKA
jgi:translation elongation factor aEF-1 beta